MAIRIVGVDLPQNKRGEIALTYVYGIGRSSSAKILDKAGVDRDLKVKDWTDDQAAKIREIIGAEYKVEGDLRSEIQLNIKRLMDIGCYRGVRHRLGLPVRGQSTKNNARTRKGRKKTVANKKKATKYLLIWQKKQSQLKKEMSRLMLMDSCMFILHSITLSFLWQTAKARLLHGLLQVRWDLEVLRRTLLMQLRWLPRIVQKWHTILA